MEKLMSMVKRNVNVEVFETSKGKYEIVLDGTSYKTYTVILRGTYTWSVPEEACQKYFGVDKESFIEHASARKILLSNQKEIDKGVAFVNKQAREYYGRD